MYPVLRLLRVYREARRRPPLGFDDTSEVTLRCWPWDLDMFFEMNNGRVQTLYDLGRFDLAVRIGLTDVLRRNRWGLAVAGASTRFRKRILGFDRIVMRTRALGRDDRWIYIEQSMWVRRKGALEAASSALVRTCVTEKGRMLPTTTVAAALNAESWRPEPPTWATSWIDADAHRPWPPET